MPPKGCRFHCLPARESPGSKRSKQSKRPLRLRVMGHEDQCDCLGGVKGDMEADESSLKPRCAGDTFMLGSTKNIQTWGIQAQELLFHGDMF